jgi:hypothetical protein
MTEAADDSVTLSVDEAVAVAELAAAYADVVPPGRDAPYRALIEAADAGVVEGPDLPALERVCALGLETGKARQLGRAEAERLLIAVYRRTPGGKEQVAEASDVNKVLAQITGRELTSARLTWRMPGRYNLDLAVNGFALTLVIGPEGLQVQSLQTG